MSTSFVRIRAPSPTALLDQARVLLRQGLTIPAMMTTRVALEEHLRRLACRAHGARFPRRLQWRIKNLTTFLMAKGIISRDQWQTVRRVYDRLSRIAHGGRHYLAAADELLADVCGIVNGGKGGAA